YSFFVGINLFFLRGTFTMLIGNAAIQMPEATSKLEWEFQFLSTTALVSLFVFMAALFVFGLFESKGIIGSLYSLKKRLQEFSSRPYGVRLNLRSRDEFRNLEELFNLAMEQSDQSRERHKNELSLILDLVKQDQKDKALEVISRN